MRLTRLALLLASLAVPAAADDLSRTASGDIDGDGKPDRVDLRRSADDTSVDVAITLSAGKRTVKVQALTGAEYADVPAFDKGEVILAFEWLTGRYKTRSRFYIGMQGSNLVVRRYEASVVDSISANPDGTVKVESCAADFVANRATRNDKPAAAPGKPIALADWKADDSVPQACQF
jgi:hypothetical protein